MSFVGAFVPAASQFRDMREDADKVKRSSEQLIICFTRMLFACNPSWPVMSIRYKSNECEVTQVEGRTVATIASCWRAAVYSAECWTTQRHTPGTTVQATPPQCRPVTCSTLCEGHGQECGVRGQIVMCTCMPAALATGTALQTLSFRIAFQQMACFSMSRRVELS